MKREDLVQRLLAGDSGDVLFVSGCATNQVKSRSQFDHIILLSAPADVLIERLRSRTTNAYGKRPEESLPKSSGISGPWNRC